MDETAIGNDSNEVPGALKGITLFNEASDIYEVEKIIAGPLRRREHLVSSLVFILRDVTFLYLHQCIDEFCSFSLTLTI